MSFMVFKFLFIFSTHFLSLYSTSFRYVVTEYRKNKKNLKSSLFLLFKLNYLFLNTRSNVSEKLWIALLAVTFETHNIFLLEVAALVCCAFCGFTLVGERAGFGLDGWDATELKGPDVTLVVENLPHAMVVAIRHIDADVF